MTFLSTPKFKLVADRAAEGAREAALLWFVFSALDALISGRLNVDLVECEFDWIDSRLEYRHVS